MPSRQELANAIRALTMDAVQRANSGHPGMPMGMADIAEVVWNDFLKHNPANPKWFDRDRFVVSNGHGSMLLYALLHLSGYDLSIDDLKDFRQLGSKTPGHPENHLTPGVETTTGPLGQGIANAVGMAIAERVLAAHFNCDGFDIVDHNTYCFVGDGCLMEGISHEVCSLAGTLRLGKLIVYYDDNGISIDGDVANWFLDDTPKRFESYGWQVIRGIDGHDPEALAEATRKAQDEPFRPTLICCKTIIGKGSPNKEGTEGVHGAPLGDDEIAASRESIGWSHAPFEVPSDIKDGWSALDAGAEAEAAWNEKFAAYQAKHPKLAGEFSRRMVGNLPENFADLTGAYIEKIQAEGKTNASRKSSKAALDVFAPGVPELIGGSADLSESNCTAWNDHRTVTPGQFDGNYLAYGVREFGMSAIMNGLSLHGGFRPFGGTFLTFSDYARNAVRMSALMELPVTYVYTHDSVGLGEDGPTHQPIEHLASLRLIPNLALWRPADDVETAVAWRESIAAQKTPNVLSLTRQNIPHFDRNAEQLEAIARGGYVLVEPEGDLQAIIIATGSEVGLAAEAAALLSEQGIGTRVVSMPCTQRFEAQDAAWKESVLPHAITHRVAVEAGIGVGWYRYVGRRGRVMGIEEFGVSAPGAVAFDHFGLNAQSIADTVRELTTN